MYKTDHSLIAQINSVQSSWTAKHYEMFDYMTIDEVIAMAGGRALHRSTLVTTLCVLLWPPYVIGRPLYFCLWFLLLLSFFFFSSPVSAVGD